MSRTIAIPTSKGLWKTIITGAAAFGLAVTLLANPTPAKAAGPEEIMATGVVRSVMGTPANQNIVVGDRIVTANGQSIMVMLYVPRGRSDMAQALYEWGVQVLPQNVSLVVLEATLEETGFLAPGTTARNS